MFGVTILGNNSALPAYGRHPSSQIVTLSDQLFMVDCGEGTQLQMAKYKIKWSKIQHIFISHLHGDHYFGLPGLLNSMGLLNRETDLHLYAPPKLQHILKVQFEAACTTLPYVLHFHPLTKPQVLVEKNRFRVSCFPTSHRIPCWGFRFDEKKAPRKININKVNNYQIPPEFFELLKNGNDYIDKNGNIIANHLLTDQAPLPKSYSYCADTKFEPSIIQYIKNSDLIFHETTYPGGMEDRAEARFHSTTFQAAEIAVKAEAGRLIIGHFSSKFESLNKFEEEARSVFPKSELALEGCTFKI